MPIHPTAIVNPRAELAADVEVGPYCIIDAHVRVGAGCRLYQQVYLTGWTEIGERCVLHPGVVVGHEPQDLKYKGERSFCRIGEGTVLRENVTVHRGTEPETETYVGKNCFFLAGSHVAHNCRVHDGVTLINHVLLGGHVEVGERATLGGGSVVHQFVRIGTWVMAPGGGRVIKDIVPFSMLDLEGHVAGLNQVGIRRAGISGDESLALRKAFHILYPRHAVTKNPIEALSEFGQFAAIQQIIEFLKGESRRGLTGRSRRRGQ